MRRGERVHLDQIAYLGIGAARIERCLLVQEVRILGKSAVHIRARQHHQLLDLGLGAELEQAPSTDHVHLMAQLRLGAEVANLAEMDHGLRPFVAEDVLEFLLEHLDDVDLDVLRVPLPRHTVGSDHLVGVGHAAGEQPPLAAGDSGDQ
jgi:hypothetical protein